MVSVVLAIVAAQSHPTRWGIVLCVLAVGAGNAVNSPAWSALLP